MNNRNELWMATSLTVYVFEPVHLYVMGNLVFNAETMMMKSELNYKETFLLCKQTKNVIRVRCAMWAAVFVSSSQPINGGNLLRLRIVVP